ncbi:enoyl-CoA hydratase-related protein [Streptosporangium sp. NPDC049644]|uniref:enoyl-CoA hydratase-related protein n=1 Tax=Streptosporangium sp. NPDC049644 TaxID=3155507 RepID=UPI0034408477
MRLEEGERLARQLYEALAEGDRDRLADLLHPGFEGRATEGLPLDLGGVYSGPKAMLGEFWGRIGRNFAARAEPTGFHLLDDGRLLVLGRYTGRARATGGELDAEFTHLIRFAESRVVQLVQLTDSARWARALAEDTPPGGPGRTPAIAGRELSAVDFQVHDGLAVIRLNRPQARNAIDEAMAGDLYEVAVRCAGDESLRAVLLIGDGPAFTVGGDISVFARASAAELPELLRRMTGPYHEALRLLSGLDAPVVAAVHGSVAGGGLGLVHCADIVLAAEGTRFALGFGALGLSGDGGGTWFLPRLVGARRAAEWYFEQRVLDAAEAADWGLVTRVVPADELEDQAWHTVRKLASGPTRAYAEVRRLLRDSWTSELSTQLGRETDALVRTAATEDASSAIAAFVDRSRPTFHGR